MTPQSASMDRIGVPGQRLNPYRYDEALEMLFLPDGHYVNDLEIAAETVEAYWREVMPKGTP